MELLKNNKLITFSDKRLSIFIFIILNLVLYTNSSFDFNQSSKILILVSILIFKLQYGKIRHLTLFGVLSSFTLYFADFNSLLSLTIVYSFLSFSFSYYNNDSKFLINTSITFLLITILYYISGFGTAILESSEQVNIKDVSLFWIFFLSFIFTEIFKLLRISYLKLERLNVSPLEIFNIFFISKIFRTASENTNDAISFKVEILIFSIALLYFLIFSVKIINSDKLLHLFNLFKVKRIIELFLFSLFQEYETSLLIVFLVYYIFLSFLTDVLILRFKKLYYVLIVESFSLPLSISFFITLFCFSSIQKNTIFSYYWYILILSTFSSVLAMKQYYEIQFKTKK